MPFFLACLVSCWASDIIYRVTRHTPIGTQRSISPSDKNPSISYLIYLTLTLGCCLSLVLFIPTGTLLSAGVIFNAVFPYHVPASSFSILLLVVVMLPHLFNEKLPVALQAFSFSATICCLFILIFFGLISGHEPFWAGELSPAQGVDPGPIPVSFWVPFCTSMLLFLGYDQGKSYLFHWKYRVLLLAIGAMIIGLWCTASQFQVPRIFLTLSTISHIWTTREILGQPGGVVIVSMIIFGTYSVVNGLFIITHRLIKQQLVSTMVYKPAVFSHVRKKPYILFVSAIIGLLLATGLEWAEELETFVFGSLLLWLLLTAVRIHAGLRAFHRAGGNSSRIHFFIPVLFLVSFITLIITHTQPIALVGYIGLVLVIASIITAAWLLNVREYHNPIALHLLRTSHDYFD